MSRSGGLQSYDCKIRWPVILQFHSLLYIENNTKQGSPLTFYNTSIFLDLCTVKPSIDMSSLVAAHALLVNCETQTPLHDVVRTGDVMMSEN
jgi:hypothetical protein